MWEQVPNDSSVLAKTLMKAQENIRQENIRLGWDLSKDTLHYFLVKDKSTRFYLLPEIHKQLHDEPGEGQLFRIVVIILKTYPHF